jgi:hypothetical protein
MKTITIKSRVGSDGVLDLRVPVGLTNIDLDVVVIFQPARGPLHPPPSREDWALRVAHLAGSIQDPTFVRHEQGHYEERDELP